MADIIFPYVHEDEDRINGVKLECVDGNLSAFSPCTCTIIGTSLMKKSTINSLYDQGSTECYSLLGVSDVTANDYVFPLPPLPRGLRYYYQKYQDESSLELIEYDTKKLYDMAYGFSISVRGILGPNVFSFYLYHLQPQ